MLFFLTVTPIAASSLSSSYIIKGADISEVLPSVVTEGAWLTLGSKQAVTLVLSKGNTRTPGVHCNGGRKCSQPLLVRACGGFACREVLRVEKSSLTQRESFDRVRKAKGLGYSSDCH